MSRRAARNSLLLAAALLLCLPLRAWGDQPRFHRGITGVRLSERVGAVAAWSPDGRWIAIPARGGLLVRNVATGEKRKLLTSPHGGHPAPAGPLAWSPDGKTIRYASAPLLPPITEEPSWLTEVQIDGTGLRRQSLGVEAQGTSWSGGDWPLAFVTGPYAFDFDKGPLGPKPSLFVLDEFGVAPRRILQIAHPKGEETITEPAISPDGRRIVFQRWGRRGSTNLWSVGADGSDPVLLAPGLVAVFTIAWSPDGSAIALGADTTRRSGQRVYTIPAGGGPLHRVVDEEVLAGPAWSPDGRWLAYSTYDGKVWRVHPQGGGRQLIAAFPGKQVENLLWSPDGRRLAYTAAPPPPSD